MIAVFCFFIIISLGVSFLAKRKFSRGMVNWFLISFVTTPVVAIPVLFAFGRIYTNSEKMEILKEKHMEISSVKNV